MTSSETLSAKLSLVFSSIGHTCSHLFGPIFYVVALSLEDDLSMSHGEVVSLIVVGNVLFGVAAPLAGWIGDKWSATGMMTLFFLGTGGGMVMTGLSSTPVMIGFALAVTGLFSSIYHPVGIAWLFRHAVNRGMALGINGVFGSVGPAIAAVSAGVLIEWQGWQAAFLVPGAVMLAAGGVFLALIRRGLIVETKVDRAPSHPAPRKDMIRAFSVLAVTALCTGIIYQATQPALPKVFSERLADLANDGVLGISLMVALVYLVSGAMQIVAGRLADKYPLKLVYVLGFVLQTPFLILAANLSGSAFVVVAIIMVSANTGVMPAENALVARYAPAERRGLVFGLKFILTLGIGGLGVLLEAKLYDYTGGFYWLFVVLGCLSIVAAVAGVLLPSEHREPAPQAAQ